MERRSRILCTGPFLVLDRVKSKLRDVKRPVKGERVVGMAGDVAKEIGKVFEKDTIHAFLAQIQQGNAAVWEQLLANIF